MSWLFTVVILGTIAQMIFCYSVDWFILVFIISLVTRAIFFARLLGATIKAKNLIITEGFALGVMLLFNILSKASNNYLAMLLYIIFSGVICICMWWDDVAWLYITEDYDERKDEE